MARTVRVTAQRLTAVISSFRLQEEAVGPTGWCLRKTIAAAMVRPRRAGFRDPRREPGPGWKWTLNRAPYAASRDRFAGWFDSPVLSRMPMPAQGFGPSSGGREQGLAPIEAACRAKSQSTRTEMREAAAISELFCRSTRLYLQNTKERSANARCWSRPGQS
jgi:hypothetical protein